VKRLVIVCGLAAVAPARADDAKDHVNPVLPALRVEGASNGNAKLKIGADFAFPIGEDSDATFSPLLVTSTNNGLGNILSFNGDTATARDFQLVLQASAVELPHLIYNDDGARDLHAQFDKCVESCKPTSIDPFCDLVNADKLAQIVDDALVNEQRLQAEATAADERLAEPRRAAGEAKQALLVESKKLEGDTLALKKLDDELNRLRVTAATAKPPDLDRVRAELKQRQAERDHLAKMIDDQQRVLLGLERQVGALQRDIATADDAKRRIDEDVAGATEHRKDVENRRKVAVGALRGKPKLTEKDALPSTICLEGKKALAEASKRRRDKRLERPERIAAVGLIFGHSQYKFLSPTTDGLLKPDSDTRESALLAGYVTWLGRDSAMTFELPFRLGFSSSLGSKTVKWCVPAGTISLGNGVTAPGQSCDELAAAPPASLTVFDAAPAIGVMPALSTSFRLALGPVVHIEGEDNRKALVRAGLQLPVYFDINLLASDKGTFKGVVKLTSSIIKEWDRPHHTEATRFVVTVELFTGRSILATDVGIQVP
jgi:hypothetical protein